MRKQSHPSRWWASATWPACSVYCACIIHCVSNMCFSFDTLQKLPEHFSLSPEYLPSEKFECDRALQRKGCEDPPLAPVHLSTSASSHRAHRGRVVYISQKEPKTIEQVHLCFALSLFVGSLIHFQILCSGLWDNVVCDNSARYCENRNSGIIYATHAKRWTVRTKS